MPNRQTGIPIARVIRSVQRGTVVPGTPAGITSVNTAKSTCVFLGFGTGSNGASTMGSFPRIALTSATVVTATANAGTDSTVSFEVVEYW